MRLIMLLSFVAVVGCSTEPQKPHIINYEAPGNLEAKKPLNCVPLSEITSQRTPADIYPGVAACIKSGAYEKAVPLYMLAGTFGRFDQLRVTDETARQAIQVLQMRNFGDLSKEQQDAFKKAMSATMDSGSSSFKTACLAIDQLGPPKYFPTYMVQHGMGAFTGRSGSGVRADFDESKGWRESVTGYLHCP